MFLTKKILVAVFLLLVSCAPVAFCQTAAPVLFFSDLVFGPNTGWNNANAQGAAVTIWGKNFGSTQGSSYVTIGGAQATSYPEWDVIGPNTLLERITFYIPIGAATGAGTISVTVNGVTSNTLPFTVDNTTPIQYIDGTNGNDSNNGRTTSAAFKTIGKFSPSSNPLGDTQYIVYVRAGTYTTLNGDSAFFSSRCTTTANCGSTSKQKAIIAYPGESPLMSTTSATHGFWYMPWDYSPYSMNNYYTIAKLEMTGGSTPFPNISGDYTRIIGNYFHDYTQSSDSGIVTFQSSMWCVVDGNLFKHNVSDSGAMSHDLYIQTQTYTPRSWVSGDHASMDDELGWNEISQFVDQTGGAHLPADFFISGHQTNTTYATHDIWIHHNYFHDGQGTYLFVSDSYPDYNIWVYTNLFVIGLGNYAGAIYNEVSCTSCYYFNNTVYHGATAQGTQYDIDSSGTHSYTTNNIWYGTSGQAPFSIGSSTLTSNYDLFYNTGGTDVNPSGTVTNPVKKDPLMVAPDSYNYHLQSSSPAIGAGVAIVYPTGTTSTTPLPSRDIDFDGISRPNPPAIGAYELPSGNPAATTPTFSPSAGTYASPQTVAINNPSSAPVVCYTTNGTTPVTNGTSGCTTGSVYSSPVSVSVTGTIKAVAGGTGYSDSAVANAVYTINIPAPARNLFAGTLQASGAVKIID